MMFLYLDLIFILTLYIKNLDHINIYFRLLSLMAGDTILTPTTKVMLTCRSGYCYLNKGEYNLNQSKDNSFVERVAKNNS